MGIDVYDNLDPPDDLWYLIERGQPEGQDPPITLVTEDDGVKRLDTRDRDG